jgi:hypothetical protein
MNIDKAFQQFQIEIERVALFELAVTIIVFIALFWATYYVIKAGVRDGIRESGLRTEPTWLKKPQGYRWELVKETAEQHQDMRAD